MEITDLTLQEILDGLHAGGGTYGLGASQFTFSIPGAGSEWSAYAAGEEQDTDYSDLTAAQASDFRLALSAWDELIAPDFTEVSDNGAGSGELRVAFTEMSAGTAGFAYLGTPRAPGGKVGDIWLNSDSVGENFGKGTSNYGTLLHEIGHTLGLKHSFSAPSLPAEFDTVRYTIMAYTGADTKVDFNVTSSGISSSSGSVQELTPMVLDIAAVQSIYGAETDTRSGNDTYSFTESDGDYLQAIYDAGGDDTIDLSGTTRSNEIDLRPGAYSSIGIWTVDEQITYWQAQASWASNFIAARFDESSYEWRDNLGIAFSTVIENAVGGAGSDTILGNDAANKLYGMAGNDIIDGGAGIDRLYGGEGDDVFHADDANERIFELAGEGFDTVISHVVALRLRKFVEALELEGVGRVGVGNDLDNSLTANSTASFLFGKGGNDTIHGGEADDRLYGGAGNDAINGGGGNDVIDGGSGNNTLTGGVGDDTFFVRSAGDVVNEDVGGGTDEIKTYVDFALPDNVENLTLFGTASVGTGNALGNQLRGTGGADNLSGGDGDDVIRGLDGTDTIDGGIGLDKLFGGIGEDILTGGEGADQFIFDEGDLRIKGSRIETITDFSQVENDTIRLNRIDADIGTGVDDDFTFLGDAAFTQTAGELRYGQNGTDTIIYGDTDGDGIADFQLMLNGLIDLQQSDFVL